MSGRFESLVRRELRAYFASPVAYIVAVGFLVFTSVWLFVLQDFFRADVASLRSYFGVIPVVFAVLVPAITMRAWAEERKSRTDELLLTLPFPEWRLVLGKFAAGYLLVLLLIALSLFVPLTVLRFGDFERGEIVGQYIGVVLLGGTAVAIGQFVSSLARNQISAFISGAAILLALTLAGDLNLILDLPSPLANALRYVSLDSHFRALNRGLIDTRDLVYFAGTAAAALFGTTRVLIARKLR